MRKQYSLLDSWVTPDSGAQLELDVEQTTTRAESSCQSFSAIMRTSLDEVT